MQQGDVIADRFELVRLAGAGGMGEVWQSRDRVSGEIAALKLLAGTSESARASFEREAQMLAELDHPGDRALRRARHHARRGEPYLAMEWLEGEDLAQRLAREAPRRATRRRRCSRRSPRRSALAHARGIVHRDIKPSNLFLVGGDVDARQGARLRHRAPARRAPRA